MQALVKQVVDGEIEFCRNLLTIINSFQKPLIALVTDVTDNFLKALIQSQLSSVFGNIGDIYKCHVKLRNMLQQVTTAKDMLNSLTQSVDAMSCYIAYLNNYTNFREAYETIVRTVVFDNDSSSIQQVTAVKICSLIKTQETLLKCKLKDLIHLPVKQFGSYFTVLHRMRQLDSDGSLDKDLTECRMKYAALSERVDVARQEKERIADLVKVKEQLSGNEVIEAALLQSSTRFLLLQGDVVLKYLDKIPVMSKISREKLESEHAKNGNRKKSLTWVLYQKNKKSIRRLHLFNDMFIYCNVQGDIVSQVSLADCTLTVSIKIKKTEYLVTPADVVMMLDKKLKYIDAADASGSEEGSDLNIEAVIYIDGLKHDTMQLIFKNRRDFTKWYHCLRQSQIE